jgi:hypothetical protein
MVFGLPYPVSKEFGGGIHANKIFKEFEEIFDCRESSGCARVGGRWAVGGGKGIANCKLQIGDCELQIADLRPPAGCDLFRVQKLGGKAVGVQARRSKSPFRERQRRSISVILPARFWHSFPCPHSFASIPGFRIKHPHDRLRRLMVKALALVALHETSPEMIRVRLEPALGIDHRDPPALPRRIRRGVRQPHPPAASASRIRQPHPPAASASGFPASAAPASAADWIRKSRRVWGLMRRVGLEGSADRAVDFIASERGAETCALDNLPSPA